MIITTPAGLQLRILAVFRRVTVKYLFYHLPQY